MKPRTIQNLACLAVLTLGAQTFASQSQEKQENIVMEHAQIQSTIDANNAAVSAGDIDGALAAFEPNAAMVAQPGVTVTGTEALRGAFQQFLAINPKITATGHDIVQAGDIALASFTWKMAGKAPDGSPVEQSGFSVLVLRKQAGGRWLIVIDNPFGDQLLGGN
jgi:uncharacterized protein (TIGR02246 family)